MKKLIFSLFLGASINAHALVVDDGGTIVNATNDTISISLEYLLSYTFENAEPNSLNLQHIEKKVNIPGKLTGKNYKYLRLQAEDVSCPAEHPFCSIYLEAYGAYVKEVSANGVTTYFGGYEEYPTPHNNKKGPYPEFCFLTVGNVPSQTLVIDSFGSDRFFCIKSAS